MDASSLATTPGTPEIKPAERKEIVRATMPLAIEPWRLAQDQEAHKKRTCGGKAECKACELVDALFRTQRQLSGAMNLVARRLYLDDAAVYDAFLLEHGREPTGKELRFPPPTNVYQLARTAYPEILSGVVASSSKKVQDKWWKERWDVLVRRTRAAAHYKDTMPIALPMQSIRLRETEIRDLFELHCSLSAGRLTGPKGKEFVIPIRAKDSRQYTALRKLTLGEYRVGEVTLERDRRNKWHAKVAYKRKIEEAKGDTIAAINRGILNIVAVVLSDGQSRLVDGNDIEAHLSHLHERRKSFQRNYPTSSRRGRGRNHALRPLQRMEEKGERWRKTRLQTIARELARWMSERGVVRVYIEDFAGIRDQDVELLDGGKLVWDRIQSWPYHQMGTRLASCCEELGIEVVSGVDPAYVSQTCPKCGVVTPADDERKISRMFKCPGCKLFRPIDVVAAMNLLLRGEALRAKGTLPAPAKKKREPKKKG